jgi:hypothetical protein
MNLMNATQIQEHMKVVGSDGQQVGTVDKVEGDRIKLAKSDSGAQGQHHYLPLDAVERVEQDRVCLRQPAQTVKQQWKGAGGSAA